MCKVLVFLSFFSVHSILSVNRRGKKSIFKKIIHVTYFVLATNFQIFMFVNCAFICIHSGVCAFLYVYDIWFQIA